MKTTILISIILLVPTLSWSQRPTLPIARPPRPILPQNPVIVGDNIIMPGGSTDMVDTNTMDTNQFEPTNAMAPELTNNNVAPTNEMSPEMVRALGLTNRLSVMAPAQVQAVTLVQVGMNDLQHAAASITGAPNIQQAIQDNPDVRKQLQMVSARIINLARGPDRPSNDSVDRLAIDLLRASSHTQLTSDEQLVLSIVINLVVNCQNLPAVQVQSSVNDALIVLRGAGVPPSVSNAFGCDLNSIALEIQPNLGI